MEQNADTIGQSVVITGELGAAEDLTIEGQVEGKVDLAQNLLTIGPKGRVKAQVQARVVSVFGNVDGNITATESISIGEQASVQGDVSAPRVAIAAGATFNGKIDMQRPKTTKVATG